MRSRNLLASSLFAIAAASISPAVYAQDGMGPEAGLQGSSGASQNPPAGDIVVTGSRIIRQDYNATSPIVTVGSERLSQTQAVTVEATLNQLPQFTPSIGAANVFPSTGGQAQLNLRGLGTDRTLVLLDGKRLQPSTPNGAVDVNVIPSSLIARVETITGGASAAYGSDAVSGVVNFILDKSFEGVELDAQYGDTTRGDGATFALSGVAGGTFADGRGHAALSISYSKRNQIQRGDRDFFAVTVANARLPYAMPLFTANPPSQQALDDLFESYGFARGSVVRTAPLGFNPDGTLFSSPGTAAGVINYRGPSTDEFPIINNAVLFSSGRTYDIQIPLERYNVFANVGYELADDVEIYGQALYTNYTALATTSYNALGLAGANGIVPVTNPFIPNELRVLLASRAQPNATFPISYSFRQRGPTSYETDYDIYQIQAGLKGRFGGWRWDVYGQIGQTRVTERTFNSVSKSAVDDLLAAPDGGASICKGGFNPFTTDVDAALSPECQDYIYREAFVHSKFRQKIVEGTIQGSPFSLPAGEVSLMLGASYRHDDYSQRPDASFQSGDIQGLAASFPAQGSQGVTEFFGEVLIPLVSDTPLIERLNLDAAYRYSNYSTVGSVSTYKVDLDWQVASALRLRGGYARAIRAPSLGELNSPATTSSVTIGRASSTTTAGDPCDVTSSFRLGANASQVRGLCLAQGIPLGAIDSFTYSSQTIFAVAQGNPDLKEETADTYSVGLILRSPFNTPALAQFQASVDYYDITIKNAIGTLPFTTALARCFNADGSNPNYSPDNENCSVISRNNLGTIQQGTIATLNLAQYETRGVDVQVDWAADFADLGMGNIGRIGLNFVASRLIDFKAQTLPGLPIQNFAGYTSSAIAANNVLPKYKSTLTLNYSIGDLSLGGRWRYIGGTTDVSKMTSAASTVPDVPAVSYFDLFGSYNFGEAVTLRAGVNNIADRDPPQVGTAVGNTDFSTYDVIGRSFYVGLRTKF